PPGEEIGGLGGASAVLEAALEQARAGAASASAGPPRRPGVQVVGLDLDTLPTACTMCPGTIALDGYCTDCGAPAARPRDHWAEQPAAWVALVCDRGLRHTVNQDGGAIAATDQPGEFVAMVVCDGVSSAARSEVASLAAARAARDVLAAPRPVPGGAAPEPGPGAAPAVDPIPVPAPSAPQDGPPVGLAAPSTSVQSHSSVLAAAVREAGAAAQDQAVAAAADPPERNPPACTFVGAVLDGTTLVTGWVGDSRAYWLPDDGVPVQLSTDDSWAAEAIALGFSREQAERAPQAHSITRWLGVDAPDPVPRTAARRVQGPGWLLLCSDGLWNYASEAADLRDLVAGTAAATGGRPLALAEALVAWANAQGGHDNITVALARIGPAVSEPSGTAATAGAGTDGSDPD
ncbi:MAG TPA: PP2C family serine/threonine-protein phosphatase, partial [Kineosporiaceae bacterium]